jgi:hypothetical protein
VAKRPAVKFAPTANVKLSELRGMAGWYLLCFDTPLVLGINVRREVRHYLGSSVNIARRLQKHATAPDARILQLAKQRGITFRVVRIWEAPEGTNGAQRWAEERRLKGISGGRLCPCCHPGTKRGCRAARPATSPIPYGEEYVDAGEDQPW